MGRLTEMVCFINSNSKNITSSKYFKIEYKRIEYIKTKIEILKLN